MLAHRIALSLGLPLALAGCALELVKAESTLAAMGYTEIATAPEPWLGSPCLWSEGYGKRVWGTRNGRRWTGVLCAISAEAEAPMLRDLHEVDGVARVRRSGLFESAR